MPLARIPKIYKIDHRIWWAVIFLSQALMAVLIVISILSNKWVELGPSGLIQGSLFKLTETSANSDVNEYWHDYWKDNCDNDTYRDSGICKMIDNLYKGSIFMSIGDAIALLLLLVWTYSFFQWIFTGKARFMRLHRPYLEAVLMLGFHIAGTILWLLYSKAKFSGSCDFDGSFSDTPDPCAKDGAKMALALMILMPIFVLLYICVFQKGYKNLLEAKGNTGNRAPLAGNANVNVLGFIPQNQQGFGQQQVIIVKR